MDETTSPAEGSPEPATPSESACIGRASMGLGALVLFLFADVLFTDGNMIASHPQGDTTRYFLWMRLFGYSELGAGNIPLWNPHTFSGTPFVGNFQSAMFYPLNLVYLLTDIRTALGLELSIHTFLLGIFFFAWMRAKAITPLSAFVAAACVMFGATASLRVLAGQMTVIDTFAWWPLLMLAIDHLSRRVSLGWLLTGVGAMSMMMLTGHPPTTLMAGIATALYCLPVLVRIRFRFRFVAALAALVVAPLFISAVQLATGLQTAAEGVRGEGMSYAFAVSHSFPPEQLLTLLVPEMFGNADAFARTYFGRVFFWDATVYMGVVGLFLALHGALSARGATRNTSIGLAFTLCIMALGGYTPLYRVIYESVPVFQFVRAPSKFMFFAAAFAAILLGLGLDRLRADRAGLTRTLAVVGALSAAIVALAVWAHVVDPESGGFPYPTAVMSALWGSGPSVHDAVLPDWWSILRRSTATSAAFGVVGLLLLGFAPGRPKVVALIALVVVCEVFLFARMQRGHTRMVVELDLRPEMVELYRRAGATRVLETAAASNIAMSRRNYALWGYDPVVLGRYIKFMAMTQNTNLAEIETPTLQQMKRFHPLHAMLRGRYEMRWSPKEVIDHGPPLPRFLFVEDYEVVAGPDAALAAIASPDFDPRRTVILEASPNLLPAAEIEGRVKPPRINLLSQSSDHIELDVTVQRPGIFVITSAYSSGWRALALEDSAQSAYSVVPANYVVRGIPLGPGQHLMRIEYSPLAYRIGARVSAASAGVFVLLVVYNSLRAPRREPLPGADAMEDEPEPKASKPPTDET